MTDEPAGAPSGAPSLRVRVEVDIPLTRRRAVHIVYDAAGETIFTCQKVGDLFSWLHENEHHKIHLLDGATTYILHFEVPPWQE